MSKLVTKIVSVIILYAVISSLMACSGHYTGDNVSFEYVPTLQQIDAQGGVVRGAYLCDEELVYEVYFEEVEVNGILSARKEYYVLPLLGEKNGSRQICFQFPSEWTRVSGIVRGDNGNYYILAQDENYAVTTDKNANSSGYFIGIYDANGNALHAQGIGEYMPETEEGINGRRLVLDSQQNIYVVWHDFLLVMDSEGTYRCSFSESNILFAAQMADGRVGYCCVAGPGQYQIKVIDPETMQSETAISDCPTGTGGIVGEDSQFWIFGTNGIYWQREEGQVPEQILNWIDTDVDSTHLEDMTVLPDGRLLLLLYDKRANSKKELEPEKGQPPELIYLEKIENWNAGRETVTVGVMHLTDNMREATICYNQEHPEYRVSIKEYMGINGYTTYEEATAALDRDMVAGKSMDIIAVTYADLDKYASKGLLEDLFPLLESSARLRREDVLKPVADTYTLDGKLVALPTWFRLEVVSGRQSMVGERESWTLPDMIDFFDRYQDEQMLRCISPEDMLEICLKFYLPCFIEEENGTCAFEQDEFYQILEFAARFTGKSSYYGWTNIYWGETRVLKRNWCVQPDYMSEMPQWFEGEETSYMGYPTPDGQSGILIETSDGNAYAILSNSAHREQAWDYLEYLILEEAERGDYFSILTDKLEQNLNAAMQEPYKRDEGGKLVTDREGNPVRKILEKNSFVGSDLVIDRYVPLPEEIEQLKDLIFRAGHVPGYQEPVMTIVREEAAAYFAGDKDVRQTARIIQNRVQVYLNEKR